MDRSLSCIQSTLSYRIRSSRRNLSRLNNRFLIYSVFFFFALVSIATAFVIDSQYRISVLSSGEENFTQIQVDSVPVVVPATTKISDTKPFRLVDVSPNDHLKFDSSNFIVSHSGCGFKVLAKAFTTSANLSPCVAFIKVKPVVRVKDILEVGSSLARLPITNSYYIDRKNLEAHFDEMADINGRQKYEEKISHQPSSLNSDKVEVSTQVRKPIFESMMHMTSLFEPKIKLHYLKEPVAPIARRYPLPILPSSNVSMVMPSIDPEPFQPRGKLDLIPRPKARDEVKINRQLKAAVKQGGQQPRRVELSNGILNFSKFQVMGIFTTQSLGSWVLLGNTDGQLFEVFAGDSVGVWDLVNVTKNAATFSDGKVRINAELGEWVTLK